MACAVLCFCSSLLAHVVAGEVQRGMVHVKCLLQSWNARWCSMSRWRRACRCGKVDWDKAITCTLVRTVKKWRCSPPAIVKMLLEETAVGLGSLILACFSMSFVGGYEEGQT